MISPAAGNVSQPSPQSNDSGNVGKSGTDDKSSDAHTNDISHFADSVPSSHPEAEGNLKDSASRAQSQTRLSYAETQPILSNGGKGNDEPSARQGGLPPQHDGTQSKGNGGYGQKPYGYYNPNGFNNGK